MVALNMNKNVVVVLLTPHSSDEKWGVWRVLFCLFASSLHLLSAAEVRSTTAISCWHLNKLILSLSLSRRRWMAMTRIEKPLGLVEIYHIVGAKRKRDNGRRLNGNMRRPYLCTYMHTAYM
jgi:hypothetical protein